MSGPLYIAFVWHMHQPYYRDLATGACSMPWVRLHATKDYLDMVKVLEGFPAIHQTFNIVPSLIDQLEEYLPPKNQSDTFLDLSRKPAELLTPQEQRFILEWFFLANPERMIRPYNRYHDLLVKRGYPVREGEWEAVVKRFKPQDFRDIQLWFNLVWIDPFFRRQNPQLAALERKGSHFTEEDKAFLLDAQLKILAEVVPTYEQFAQTGQIELACSPYYHPIMPLLCDTNAARMGLPHGSLPKTAFRHPEDAQWQLKMALDRHKQVFGESPQGIWPSEGSVSEAFVQIALQSGIRWIGTDEAILWRTLKTERQPSLLYRPHRLKRDEGQLSVIFRDRELSDAIGFVYSQWDVESAVSDFIRRLEGIGEQTATNPIPPLISIILDGENAWEFYPADGHEFLTRLYQALSIDARFRCVTVAEYLKQFPPAEAESLPELFSGSWIDANFATWIGHVEKNDAWQHLSQLRDSLSGKDREDPAFLQAWKSLGAAEGSDWMWWFGDTHFTAQADEFDHLFRRHVANAYELAGLEPPKELSQPIRRKVFQPLYEPTGLMNPVIDGKESSYYEWLYAGRLDLRQQYSAIHRASQYLQGLLYGMSDDALFLRFDVEASLRAQLSSWKMRLRFSSEQIIEVNYAGGKINAAFQKSGKAVPLTCAFDRIIELAVPAGTLGNSSKRSTQLSVELHKDEEVLERYPAEGSFVLATSIEAMEDKTWPV